MGEQSNYYSEQMMKSIDTIVKNNLNTVKFDRTEICKIISKNDKETDENEICYWVSNEAGLKYQAYSFDNFAIGTKVYVLVPQSNYEIKKKIIGKYSEEQDQQKKIYTNPFDKLVVINTFEFEFEQPTDFQIIADNSQRNITKTKEFQDPCLNCGFGTPDYFAIEFTATTGFGGTEGTFYLRPQLKDNNNNVLLTSKQQDKLTFSSKQIQGNPYYLTEDIKIQHLFYWPEGIEIDNIKKIDFTLSSDGKFNYGKSMEQYITINSLTVYYGYNIENENLEQDKIILSLNNTDSLEYTTINDIKELSIDWCDLKNKKIYNDALSYDIRTKYYIFWEQYSLFEAYVKENNGDTINLLRKCYYKENGRIYTRSQYENNIDVFFEEETEETKGKYKNYYENALHSTEFENNLKEAFPKKDIIQSGAYWKTLQNEDTNNYSSSFSYNLIPETNWPSEDIKVIIKGVPKTDTADFYKESNVLHFTNTIYKVAPAEINQIKDSLTFTLEENDDGIYNEYGIDNKLIKRNQVHQITAHFTNGLEWNNNLQNTIWKIPKNSSMLTIPKIYNSSTHKYENDPNWINGDDPQWPDNIRPIWIPENEEVNYYINISGNQNISYGLNNQFNFSRTNNNIECKVFRYQDSNSKSSNSNGILFQGLFKFQFGTQGTSGIGYSFNIYSDSNGLLTNGNNSITFTAHLENELGEEIKFNDTNIEWSFLYENKQSLGPYLTYEINNNTAVITGLKNNIKPLDLIGDFYLPYSINNYKITDINTLDLSEANNLTTLYIPCYNNDDPCFDFLNISKSESSSFGKYYIKYGSNIQINYSDLPNNYQKYSILVATLNGFIDEKTNKPVVLKAYYPIPITTVQDYYITGASQIIYDYQGTNPNYDNEIYKLYDRSNNTEINVNHWIIEHLEADNADNYPSLKDIKKRDGNDNIILGQAISPLPNMNTINKPCRIVAYGYSLLSSKPNYNVNTYYYYDEINNEYILEDRVFSDSEWDNIWDQYYIYGELYSSPILILQNTYAFSLLNTWDGSTYVGENEIMTQLIGAGRKNSENQYTGVLMGAVSEAGADATTGIYGFQDGALRYKLDEYGSFYVGNNSENNECYISFNEGNSRSNNNELVIKVKNFELDTDYLDISSNNKLITIFDETQTIPGEPNKNMRIRIGRLYNSIYGIDGYNGSIWLFPCGYDDLKNLNEQGRQNKASLYFNNNKLYLKGDIKTEEDVVSSKKIRCELTTNLDHFTPNQQFVGYCSYCNSNNNTHYIRLGQIIAGISNNQISWENVLENVSDTNLEIRQNDQLGDSPLNLTYMLKGVSGGRISLDYIAVNIGVGRTFNLEVNSSGGVLKGNWINGSSVAITSDYTKKNSITLLSDNYNILFDNLQSVQYKYNDGTSNRFHTGFIAQDVEQAILNSNLTTQDFAGLIKDKDGNYYLRYEEFIALNTWQIQKLKARVAELEQEIKEIKNEIN